MKRINYNLIYKETIADIKERNLDEALAIIYGRIRAVLGTEQYSDAQKIKIIKSITQAIEDKITEIK